MPDLPVLLLAPDPGDGGHVRALLTRAGIACIVRHRLDELIAEVAPDIGALLVSDEALREGGRERLIEALSQQPSWSDLPVVVLTRGSGDDGRIEHDLARVGNVTVLERPVRGASLVSVLRAARRARERQHQIRGHLETYERLTARLERLAFYDPLTGLPNRTLLRERLAATMEAARAERGACAVLFLDFDDFKVINDSLGHDFGDRVLRVLAERIGRGLGEADTVARLGGDEFVVVLRSIAGAGGAAAAAHDILERVAAPFLLGDREVHITTSIGIAPYTGGDESPEDLLKHADLAMYEAKDAGKQGFCFFTPVLHERALERLSLEGELRRALTRDEFVLHYQPRVRLPCGRITGYEALVRWRHPTRGLLRPERFIPIAESTGLIWDLGRLVLHEACRQHATWQAAGAPPLRMAVNLSARQLERHEVVDLVEDALVTTGLEPRRLELEITETAAMTGLEDTFATLSALKELGVRLSIDDFGTGYSSLAYLQRLPVDHIKIDRRFLDAVDEERRSAHNEAIVRAITAMGKNLGLRLIGEGVERAAQNRFLAAVGCDEGQGYFYGRPMPVEWIRPEPPGP